MVGWSSGLVAGKAEIITNSAQLGLELGLNLAKAGDTALVLVTQHYEDGRKEISSRDALRCL